MDQKLSKPQYIWEYNDTIRKINSMKTCQYIFNHFSPLTESLKAQQEKIKKQESFVKLQKDIQNQNKIEKRKEQQEIIKNFSKNNSAEENPKTLLKYKVKEKLKEDSLLTSPQARQQQNHQTNKTKIKQYEKLKRTEIKCLNRVKSQPKQNFIKLQVNDEIFNPISSEVKLQSLQNMYGFSDRPFRSSSQYPSRLQSSNNSMISSATKTSKNTRFLPKKYDKQEKADYLQKAITQKEQEMKDKSIILELKKDLNSIVDHNLPFNYYKKKGINLPWQGKQQEIEYEFDKKLKSLKQLSNQNRNSYYQLKKSINLPYIDIKKDRSFEQINSSRSNRILSSQYQNINQTLKQSQQNSIFQQKK